MDRTVLKIQPTLFETHQRPVFDLSVKSEQTVTGVAHKNLTSHNMYLYCYLFVSTVLFTLWGTCSWTRILALIRIQVPGTLWGVSLFATQETPQLTTVCVQISTARKSVQYSSIVAVCCFRIFHIHISATLPALHIR